jgi:hypothetical protein
MKNLLPLLLALPAFGLSACYTDYGDYAYAGTSAYQGYGAGSSAYYVPAVATAGYAGYATRPVYSRSYPYYSGGYARPYPYSRYSSGYDCDNVSYAGRYSSGSYRGDDCRVSSSRSSSSSYRPKNSEVVRLVDYNESRNRSVPSGYHSKQYFKDRGFDLKKNTFVNRDGDYRGKVPKSGSSSRSSSSKSSDSRPKGKISALGSKSR